MKKLSLVILAACMLSLTVLAQNEAVVKCEGHHKEGFHKKLSPEDRALKLTEKFQLNDLQKDKLIKLFRDNDASRAKASERRKKEMEREHAKMEKAMERSDKELGKIIGADNLRVLQQERLERVKARNQHHAKPCCHKTGCCKGKPQENSQD